MPYSHQIIDIDNATRLETLDFNRSIRLQMQALPDQWQFAPSILRERRLEGSGAFQTPHYDKNAKTLRISGNTQDMTLRYIQNNNTNTNNSVLIYIHGGGFVFGAADLQDDQLNRLSANAGVDVVSVDYRLAPEHPYPAGADDCEAAVLWVLQEGASQFGWKRFALSGDSAGANLALVTALRLRNDKALCPFVALVLNCGFFDLNLTPSARNWGDDKLITSSRDLRMYANHYLALGGDPYLPDTSPLYARLHELPPTLLTVGTEDPLFDDSVFLASRLKAAGSPVSLNIYPHGCHHFQSFNLKLAKLSHQRIDTFLRNQINSSLTGPQ
ncbi:alpha/beta hydrolase [Polycladidibacter stylochi]|uniref:alpha/beta hydrolase n=1 Tax=Polycladidibacter stylochi TaxID=1807766 RepID=UPI00082D1E7D|nr:alpha/beta hydrolase [Pseudovibrio stylochi]